MAPSFVTIDTADDDFSPVFSTSAQQNGVKNGNGITAAQRRTLLLAPPSIASHEESLRGVFATLDRATTDLQMLDRLSAGLVALPPAAYDLVLLVVGADGGLRGEAGGLLGRDVFERLVPAMKPGARLANQDGSPVADTREAVLAGLVADGSGGFTRPNYEEEAAVPLRFGKKKNNNNITNGNANGNGNAHSSVIAAPAVSVSSVVVQASGGKPTTAPAGVGFVNLDDLGDYESGDELLDEDDILTEEDRNRPIQKPPACPPGRKRACADCTCGLAERLEAEDKARRAKADNDLNALKLAAEDLTEMDFTVQGKTGSCGNCSLGDSFRCATCPYIGLPAFQPGEEVRILENLAQF